MSVTVDKWSAFWKLITFIQEIRLDTEERMKSKNVKDETSEEK